MKLTVNTGAMTIDVENEKGRKIGEFEFIPTDSNILQRYESVVDFFNGIKFPEDMSEDQSIEEIKKLDKDIRDQFDFLLGYHVSDGLFGQCGPLTSLADGDFYFENVMAGVANLISNIQGQRVKKKMEKIKKATAAYHK